MKCDPLPICLSSRFLEDLFRLMELERAGELPRLFCVPRRVGARPVVCGLPLQLLVDEEEV